MPINWIVDGILVIVTGYIYYGALTEHKGPKQRRRK